MATQQVLVLLFQVRVLAGKPRSPELDVHMTYYVYVLTNRFGDSMSARLRILTVGLETTTILSVSCLFTQSADKVRGASCTANAVEVVPKQQRERNNSRAEAEGASSAGF